MRDVRERLADILDAIERIEKYAARGREAFDRDELIQNWVVHHLLIIGEAARAVPDDFRRLHPAVPWSQIVGMRNVLVHDYFVIDKDIVWAVVEKDLPGLKASIQALLA